MIDKERKVMIDLNRNTGSRLPDDIIRRAHRAARVGGYVSVKAVACWAFACGFGIGMAVTALIVGGWYE